MDLIHLQTKAGSRVAINADKVLAVYDNSHGRADRVFIEYAPNGPGEEPTGVVVKGTYDAVCATLASHGRTNLAQ